MDLKSKEFSNKNQNLTILLYKLLKINSKHIAKVDNKIKCNNCNSTNKKFFTPIVTLILMRMFLILIYLKFYLRAIGKCLDCDLIQEYNYLNLEELKGYEKILTNKDMTVSEEIFHKFPIPEERKKLILIYILKKDLKHGIKN